jgi:ABC-2 type transport system ATP-binding protein
MTELAIELTGINKSYPEFELKDVNLKLGAGQIMGFVGPNGAGKSTTIRILMGLIHQDRGECRVLGHPMPKEQIAAKQDIGFASEDMRLYKFGTLAWHMRFIASIYPSWDEDYAQTLVRRFELRPEQTLRRFSHGECVKSMLLLALAHRPKLLVLDEPTTGLDPVARHELLHEFMDVLRDEDRTILFSSHNTQDVEQISDQITFIDQGRIIESRDKETFLDRWRRIRLEVPEQTELPGFDAVIDLQRSGNTAIATADGFEPAIADRYRQAGALVHAVEPMTLEEIFIANVRHGRKRRRA